MAVWQDLPERKSTNSRVNDMHIRRALTLPTMSRFINYVVLGREFSQETLPRRSACRWCDHTPWTSLYTVAIGRGHNEAGSPCLYLRCRNHGLISLDIGSYHISDVCSGCITRAFGGCGDSQLQARPPFGRRGRAIDYNLRSYERIAYRFYRDAVTGVLMDGVPDLPAVLMDEVLAYLDYL
jgi:hypothetical protein